MDMNCLDEKALAQFISGSLTLERSAAIREHLTRCACCKDAHTTIEAVTSRLAAKPGEFDAPDFVAGVMGRIVDHVEQQTRAQPISTPRRWRWIRSTLLTTATAALLLVAWLQKNPIEDPAYRSRGAASMRADQWVSIEGFRATEGGYQPIRGEIAAGDALAFAYSNPSDDGYRFLTGTSANLQRAGSDQSNRRVSDRHDPGFLDGGA